MVAWTDGVKRDDKIMLKVSDVVLLKSQRDQRGIFGRQQGATDAASIGILAGYCVDRGSIAYSVEFAAR